MSITNDQTATANDFITQAEANATPANDSGKVVQLESDGKLARFFIRSNSCGDGSDGAFSSSSGTTTINCAGARIVFKQYTTFSLTGTANIVGSNPHDEGTTIIFLVQGASTNTSSATRSIDLRSLGGIYGAGVSSGGSSPTGNGGRGAGAFFHNCGGALNWTGSVDASGGAASNATDTGSIAGASAGGGAGTVLILGNSITASSSTITVTAGANGTGVLSGGTAGGAVGLNGTSGKSPYFLAQGGRGGGASAVADVEYIPFFTDNTMIFFGLIPLVPGGGGGSGQSSGAATAGAKGHSILGSSGTGYSFIGVNKFFV